jgi:hypothetical protein
VVVWDSDVRIILCLNRLIIFRDAI